MRRLFWLALGATVGVLVVRRIDRAARAYTPEGIGRSLSSAADGLRDLADAVRDGMAEREGELRRALGVEPGDPEGPSAPGAPSAPADPYDRGYPQDRGHLDGPDGPDGFAAGSRPWTHGPGIPGRRDR